MKFLILCLLVLISHQVYAGIGEAHGGEPIIGEIENEIKNLRNAFLKMPQHLLPHVGFAQEFEKATQKMQVELVENVYLGGARRTAINFPQQDPPLLYISSEKWTQILTESEKRRLLIHEYLPVLGFDDSDYSLSIRLSQYIEGIHFRRIDSLLEPKAHYAELSDFIKRSEMDFDNSRHALYLMTRKEYFTDTPEWYELFRTLHDSLGPILIRYDDFFSEKIYLGRYDSKYARKALQLLEGPGAL